MPEILGGLPEKGVNNVWFVHNKSDTVFVFVHGVFSSSRSAWLSDNEVFWPELVSSDPTLGNPSIFLGGYYTEVLAGSYSIRDAASDLYRRLSTPIAPAEEAVLSKKRILFICHSTGGIVVRDVLVNRRRDFQDKTVGLMLVASPSLGSKDATRLSWLASYFKNQIGLELQWDHPFLAKLDDEFKELVYHRLIPSLRGIEAVENHLIGPKPVGLWRDDALVERESAGRYFGAPVTLAGTDHFSAVKPEDVTHPAHVLLRHFYSTDFNQEWVNATLQKYVVSPPWHEQNRSRTFVRPSLWPRALDHLKQNRLLSISGPAGTGKTTLAFELAYALERDRVVRRVLDFPRDGRLVEIEDLTQVLVVLDDPFGSIEFDPLVKEVAEDFERLERFLQRNYAILTTRSEVLGEARQRTRFGERRSLEESVLEIGPEAYSRRQRSEMLERHLTVAEVSPGVRDWVEAQKEEALDALAFPLNYQVFAELLSGAESRSEVDDAINGARQVERSVGRWFSNLYETDKEVFCFLLTLAFFWEIPPKEFHEAHTRIVEAIREVRRFEVPMPMIGDVGRLVAKTNPYVQGGSLLDYCHSAYRDGVTSEIEEKFLGELLAVLDGAKKMVWAPGVVEDYVLHCWLQTALRLPHVVLPYLKQAVTEDRRYLLSSVIVLAELGREEPAPVLDIVKEWLAGDSWELRQGGVRLASRLAVALPEQVVGNLEKWAECQSEGELVTVLESIGVALPRAFDGVFPVFARWAESEAWMVRKTVAHELRNTPPERRAEARGLLDALLHDGQWMVASAAESTLHLWEMDPRTPLVTIEP